MSKQSFEAFIAELGKDNALREEAKALAEGDSGVSLSALARFAEGKGYRFSVEDVSSELSDEQLDAVAGGLKWQPLALKGEVIPKLEIETTLKVATGDYYFKFY